MKVQQLRNQLEQRKGALQQLEKSITTLQSEIHLNRKALIQHEKAREVIRIVGLDTQKQLSFHISSITSLALETVFDNPYTLEVEFVQRRNKTECDLLFARDGNRYDPLSASGVGAVDVAAFALRIACWSMQRPRSNNVMILDEPFKHLKGLKENKRVLEMMREISERLGIQILMVSDERIPREDIVEAADKVFEVSIHNGVTSVK